MLALIAQFLSAALAAAFLFIAAGTGLFFIVEGGTALSLLIGWGLITIVWFMVTLLFMIMKDFAK
jgi:hypothetical protein